MTMAQLDTISGNMHELCKTTGSGGSSAASQPLDKLLFPHRMSVMQWQWAAKVFTALQCTESRILCIPTQFLMIFFFVCVSLIFRWRN